MGGMAFSVSSDGIGAAVRAMAWFVLQLRIQGSDKGKVAGLFGLNLAKGVNLIANGDYDTQKAVTNVGLQLTLDA